MEVDVDNPTGRLLPGAYAFAHLKVPTPPGAVTVPTNTLLFRSEGLIVAVVRNGQAKLVPVTIGRDYGGTVEVMSSLRADDAVIISPSDSILDGSPVEVTELFQKLNGSLSIDQDRLKFAEYKIRVLEERLRLVRKEKYEMNRIVRTDTKRVSAKKYLITNNVCQRTNSGATHSPG